MGDDSGPYIRHLVRTQNSTQDRQHTHTHTHTEAPGQKIFAAESADIDSV